MKPRVVVTGSEGFVGRHLRAAFAARGVDVVGVGRPRSGAEVEIDLAARDLDVPAVVQRIGPVSGVVYLAAMIVRTSSVDAVARENLEVIATRAAEWMEATHAQSPDAHFVYCSTLKAYGPAVVQPIDPMLPPQEPDPWSYGSAKAFAERILETGAARSGASHCVVRLTYVYGPGQHPGNAIPAFLRACWSGQAPIIFGEGAEVRDDVYAPDVAYILAEACLRRARGAFHAGSGRAMTLLETAKACCRTVEALGGPAVTPILDASRPPKWWLDRSFDVARTRSLLDYEPTSLEEALRREAEWVRDGAAPDQAIAAAPPDLAARWPEGIVSRVVITGATGRLGRPLVALLAGRGHEIVVVPRSVDLATDAAIASLKEWLRAGDVVVHLAALHPADPSATTFADLRALIDVNVLGTMRLLDACRTTKPAKLVFPSTHDVLPQDVTGGEPDATSRVAPRNDFAATKLAGEDHLRSFEYEEGIPFTALRFGRPTAAEALQALSEAVESPAAGIRHVRAA